MALRWTTAGMIEASKGFRRLKAFKYLPVLRAALAAHASKHADTKKIEPKADATWAMPVQALACDSPQVARHFFPMKF